MQNRRKSKDFDRVPPSSSGFGDIFGGRQQGRRNNTGATNLKITIPLTLEEIYSGTAAFGRLTSIITAVIGTIGFILYLMIYLKVFSFVYTLGKKTKDKFWKTICFSTAGCIIYIILYNSFYDLFSVAPIILPLWIFLGFIYKNRRQIINNDTKQLQYL